MANATLIGIDLGKHRFFVHAQDARGAQVWRKKMTRKQLYAYLATCPVAVLAMEACAGAHWLGTRRA
ncbi:transposase [Caballeronia hypogeia]|uniref:Transposase n=1 Tax=Caballeronia hypogeia TaxID=1777140 RepID=A0A158B204_9BURK|nr:transposase [Caballeronia hypogeia]